LIFVYLGYTWKVGAKYAYNHFFPVQQCRLRSIIVTRHGRARAGYSEDDWIV
jgi:hypothetical protein